MGFDISPVRWRVRVRSILPSLSVQRHFFPALRGRPDIGLLKAAGDRLLEGGRSQGGQAAPSARTRHDYSSHMQGDPL